MKHDVSGFMVASSHESRWLINKMLHSWIVRHSQDRKFSSCIFIDVLRQTLDGAQPSYQVPGDFQPSYQAPGDFRVKSNIA